MTDQLASQSGRSAVMRWDQQLPGRCTVDCVLFAKSNLPCRKPYIDKRPFASLRIRARQMTVGTGDQLGISMVPKRSRSGTRLCLIQRSLHPVSWLPANFPLVS